MTTSDFKKGLALRYKGETYVVTGYQFVNPGKGAAFTRTKIKNVKSQKVLEVTFRSDEQIEEANMEYRRAQYLYNDGTSFHFMDSTSYEQFEVNADVIGSQSNYLVDGADVKLVFVDHQPVSLQLPAKMEFTVIDAPSGEKGDTATGGSKQVTIDTGAKVSAPLFIKKGEKIRVNTETGQYVERAT